MGSAHNYYYVHVHVRMRGGGSGMFENLRAFSGTFRTVLEASAVLEKCVLMLSKSIRRRKGQKQ